VEVERKTNLPGEATGCHQNHAAISRSSWSLYSASFFALLFLFPFFGLYMDSCQVWRAKKLILLRVILCAFYSFFFWAHAFYSFKAHKKMQKTQPKISKKINSKKKHPLWIIPSVFCNGIFPYRVDRKVSLLSGMWLRENTSQSILMSKQKRIASSLWPSDLAFTVKK
jgi:hypothetical protein